MEPAEPTFSLAQYGTQGIYTRGESRSLWLRALLRGATFPIPWAVQSSFCADWAADGYLWPWPCTCLGPDGGARLGLVGLPGPLTRGFWPGAKKRRDGATSEGKDFRGQEGN